MLTKLYGFYTQKNILKAKTSINFLAGQSFHHLLTIYFQTSPKDDPVKVFVVKNVRHLTKISSLFADHDFTDKVTH